MYPEELFWNRCKTLIVITGYEYTHHPYYPAIIHFVSPFIESCINITDAINIPDASTYEKTRRQRSTTTSSKSTNDQNGPKRKMKNTLNTQMTQDEVSVTDTQQQTSEH